VISWHNDDVPSSIVDTRKMGIKFSSLMVRRVSSLVGLSFYQVKHTISTPLIETCLFSSLVFTYIAMRTDNMQKWGQEPHSLGKTFPACCTSSYRSTTEQLPRRVSSLKNISSFFISSNALMSAARQVNPIRSPTDPTSRIPHTQQLQIHSYSQSS